PPAKTSGPMRTAPVAQSAGPVPASPAARTRSGTMKIRMIRIGKDRYCYLNDVAQYYRMRIRYYKNGVELYSPGQSIRFYNDKRTGSIDYVPVSFLYLPVLRAKSQYFIHEKDVGILIASVKSVLQAASPVKTILLDPGHGGTDFGALGEKIHEKQMNLAAAFGLRTALTALGYRVVMTRTKDQTLSLDQRVALCKTVKPDLFVSLHCNAAASKSASGVETYAPTPFGAPSSGKKTAAAVDKPDPGNVFDRNNYRLAYEIQKAVVAQTKAVDRGVKVARYKVIRESSCPAALVEIGFITNASEQKKFIDPSYRKKIVDGLALGIHNYAKCLVTPRPGAK
ncbi:MAG: N-acetylmuramoyl-L-alanine amidase, partial [Lentisphaeria bacterium]|nr:N-acetylmuramoyl-L-alanine amidase [Lentisphaeria bacterium]